MSTPHAATPTSPLRLCSALSDVYQTDLEELLFFNPGQGDAAGAIEQSIGRHGVPEITSEAGRLFVGVGTLGRVQALFALHSVNDRDELVGVVLYCRISIDELVILHIAVRESCVGDGSPANMMVVLRLVGAVREVAARLKGLKTIVMYQSSGPFKFSVAPARTLADVVA